jgi:hypothetical protein
MTTARSYKIAISVALFIAASAPAAPTDPFKTTDDYVRGCSTAKLSDDCYQGYEHALLPFVLGKNTARICVPSQDGTANGDSAYATAENLEITHLVAWLGAHPQPVNQDYVLGLGAAIAAIYGCK